MGLLRRCEITETDMPYSKYKVEIHDGWFSCYWGFYFDPKAIPEIINTLVNDGMWFQSGKPKEAVPKWAVKPLLILLAPLCAEAATAEKAKVSTLEDEVARERNNLRTATKQQFQELTAMKATQAKNDRDTVEIRRKEVGFLRRALSAARAEISKCRTHLSHIGENVAQASQSERNPSERQKLIAEFKKHSPILDAYEDDQDIVVVLHWGQKITNNDYLREVSENGYVMIPDPSNRYMGTKVKVTFV